MATKDKGKSLANGRFMTPKFRINYPCVCTRRGPDEEYDPNRYTVQAVFGEDADLSMIEKAIEECAKKAGFKKGWKSPLRDGDEEYGEGTTFANLKFYGKRGKPVVLWADKTPVESDEEIIPGGYGRAIVSVFAYDKNGGKGVSIAFESLQCLGGGKRFVGGAAAAAAKMAEEEFDDSSDMGDTVEEDDLDDL
jgi:hypothetical protein